MSVSIITLIESAIGVLAMKIVSQDEKHTLQLKSDEINDLLKMLQEVMSSAKEEDLYEEEFIDALTAVLKSIDFFESREFWIYLYKNHNEVFKRVAKDELINKRFWHLRNIESISKCLSSDNLIRIRDAINKARIVRFQIENDA